MLLVVAALAAAYASRNLVFEQRTAANQVRATQAFEAAEGSLEWALAMLHAGRLDAACMPLADPDAPGATFRDRRLAIDAATGRVAARLRSDGQPRAATCVADGLAWRCAAAPTTRRPRSPRRAATGRPRRSSYACTTMRRTRPASSASNPPAARGSTAPGSARPPPTWATAAPP
jgi:hypothetical protein